MPSSPPLDPVRARRIALPALAPLLLLAFACGSVKTPTEPPAGPPAGAAYTFSRIQGEIFSPICAQAGCHDAATASGGQVLAAGVAYGNIVGVRSTEVSTLNRIEPGDPERSYMVKKLRGDSDIVGERMPRIGGPLSQSQIDGIAAWVRAGAPNN